jgi:16S rRNA (guanine966-N2)-methyltransferase
MRIIAGIYKRRKIFVPKVNGKGNTTLLRPTSDRARETLFDILNNIVDFESLVCLDLFAGTGALGFESLSRGAVSCDFVDTSGTNLMSIKRTAAELGCTNQISVFSKNALTFLNETDNSLYDLIFSDPPYTYKNYYELTRCVLNLKPEIFVLETSGDVVFKNSSKEYSIIRKQVGSAGFHIFQKS